MKLALHDSWVSAPLSFPERPVRLECCGEIAAFVELYNRLVMFDLKQSRQPFPLLRPGGCCGPQ